MDFDNRFEWLLWTRKPFWQIDLNPLWICGCGDQVGKLLRRFLIENRFAPLGCVQVLDQTLHSIVDATDPNTALIAIQAQHHRFMVVDCPHEVVRVISQRNNLHFALEYTRFVNVIELIDSNFDRTFLDANGGLEFVVQR